MKKKVFSLMMMLLLAVTGFVRADELTVHEGTATSSYVPVYGFYADAYLKAEFVMPAAELTAMANGDITAMKFYASQSSVSWGNADFQVFLTEVGDASISAFNGPGTIVYEGALGISGGEMNVTFATPYHYNGGNLLIGVYNTVKGSYVSSTWYGETVSDASVQGYSYSSLEAITPSQRNFLPQTTFTYTGGGGGGGGGTVDQLHVKYMNGDVEVIDELNLGIRPAGAWMEPFNFTMYTEGATYTVNILDFTPSDGLFNVTGEDLPFQVVRDEDVDLMLTTNSTEAGLIDRQFVAITEGDRAAHIWPITVELYAPEIPDVWEKAKDFGTVENGFTYAGIPSQITPTELHNDYTLPFPEIEEGVDAVYKFKIENDMIINAHVDENAQNGKVALYTEDFYGQGGPMADNNYQGLSASGNGGSGGGAPFEAQIGEGTTTSTYFPFHTLWNYSLSENLYLASELAEAGATSAPMTSLSWYVYSTTCTTPQNNISIWMANVGDEALTATSHTTAGMTLVYTGNGVLPVAGEWNEFVFNEGTFSWDGHSNVLVVCQRLNGAWQGSVQWQTHNPGFTAMCYDYDDYEVYDALTTSYSMYTSATNRANVILKGGGRTDTPDPNANPTPGEFAAEVSAGPVITNLPLTPGTYYLVASATQPDYTVYINLDEMPCPAIDAEGFAFNPTPADNDDEIEPGSVTLRWMVPEYATGWRLVFGSTYYPDPNHVQTIMFPEDGSFTRNMANSYTVRNLWNNTNYFWHVEFNNDGCPEGVSSPVWGFTTHLNIPTNLTAEDYTVFNDEHVVLHWNAVVDRTYRQYFIYRDGVKVGETQVNNIGHTTFTDELLAYNMNGYTYYVTAIYDEGESNPSDPITVRVSGYGNVEGHVYEQDGTTGIANATVTMVGEDEFGDSHTYTFTTDGQGYYTGHIYTGSYDGSAACNGYQPIDAPVQGNPIAITYNNMTSPVDYMLDENFYTPCSVVAQYYPDSTDVNSPYVKVIWGCGLPGEEIIEPFETGDFSKFDWQLDNNYPWSITTNNPYEGTYCMKSGGAGVANVVSNMTVTVNIPSDGVMSFFGKISSESNYDYGRFFIDGVEKGNYSGNGTWSEKTFDITAGDHIFQWRYTKDGSVNSNDDCFYVDYITFYRRSEPALPGMTYDFDNSTMQGWTSVDADGDGYGWYVASEIMSTGYGHNDSNDCVLSQSYSNSTGILYPDNYLVSPQVQLGGVLRFYACAQDASYAAEHFGVAVSTTNTNPSSFSMVQEWTMSAKAAPADNGKPVRNSRSGRAQGNWYEYTVDLSAYSGMGYVAIRHFNCSDMFYLDVDDITIGEPSKGMTALDRSFLHYRVYRTNCYNDGPYTEENTVVLACELLDTLYIDVSWPDAAPGVYKWGVGCVYSGNRGEEIEGEISWSEPIAINPEMANRDQVFDFENGQIPADWTNDATYPWTVVSNAYAGYNGTYCIKSGNGGVASSTSSISTTVTYTESGTVSFLGGFWGEGSDSSNWDKCRFYIDGVLMIDYGNHQQWENVVLPVTAGTHTFTWEYKKDSTVNPTGDAFFVDDVTFTTTGSGGGNNNGGYGPGTEPIQEPRESVIVWSRCLDKDMYLDNVTVNVLLNSADSPEGTTVDFTNLNEVEQQNYPVGQLVLDESGFYAFETFRRGEYAIKIRHDGYEPIDDTVSIWENTDLRYVMIEILYGVQNVYVSRTGWAMWDEANVPGGGGGGQGGGNASTFSENFDAGMPAGWTTVDADGDGYTWVSSMNPGVYHNSGVNLEGTGHNGSAHYVISGSYANGLGYALTPDNFLVSPQVTLASGSTFSFWACAQDASWAAEHFGVAISDNGTSNWTMVQEWTMTAKAGGDVMSYGRGGNNRAQGNWYHYTVDLSSYAGQKYIGIRHFNCTDMFILNVDDIELTSGAKSEDRHLEYYKVMCTSIDDVPIFNHNTVHPFCQLSTNEPYNAPLVEGEHYLCKVACMYSTGLSAWSDPVEWVYEPCDHWGPVDEVSVEASAQGNHIEWVFEHGFNPYGGSTPGPGPGGPGSTFNENFDTGIPAGWTTVDADGDGYTWVSSMNPGVYHNSGVNLEGTGHNSSAHYVISGSYANGLGYALTPDNFLVSPQVTLAAGSTFSFWACAQDASWAAEHFGVAISDNGTSNWTMVQEWTMTAKAGGDVMSYGRGGNNRAQGNWYHYTVDLSAYAGQKYIGIRHFNCTDMFILNVDDIELTAGTKGGLNFAKGGEFYTQYAEDGVMLNFFALDNVNFRVYMLSKLSNDSRFTLVPEEEYGQFVLTSNVANSNFMNEFESVYQNAIADFDLLSKVDIDDRINGWKSSVSSYNLTSVMMDVLMSNARVDNDHCVNSLPFCTSETITFEAASTSNTANEPGMDDGCIGSSYNPSFYHMRIHTGGPFVIHMEGHDPNNPSTTRDIDFCMWGPYTEQEVMSGSACSNLTGNKIMDCCYSASYTEDCYLGYPEGQHQHNTSHGTINYHVPEVGEYYILMITNFSQQPCVISFTKTEGEGETDCEIVTPTDLIGFLITEDGEYVAFAGPDDREYTVEGEYGDHEYCVRPIYPGEMILPDHNYGWSMGCPVCEFGPSGATCAAYMPIHGEAINATDQVKIWWGEENPGPGPGGCEGDEFTVDFESGMPTGWTTIDADGDGYNWMLASTSMGTGYGHNGSSDLILSQSYNNNVGALNPDNYLVSPAVTLCEGSTFSFWACAQDNAWASEHFGVAVSETGTGNWTMVQEWTMTAKGEGKSPRGMNEQGNWYNYTVDLSAYAGEGRYIAIRHFNCTDWFYLDVDDIQLTNGAKSRANIVNFKVYRSTDNVDYTLINTVAYVAGQTYYEYIDTPAGAGTYYYQVTTVYDNDCESEPAAAFDNPNNDYVEVGVTGIGENDGKVALYPNPTKGNVTIQANGMSRITVVSMLGQVVFDTELNADVYTLNMAQFNAGMYMVRVYTEEGMTVKRVTVMQ
ncbi:MAG: choice-of-anchor J domain-containing protein [Muribaculaceae bacterium]|nr:choice-of-anchor J domain-containing protein [Muribaculaceae bacterium]